jgi:hypothetical protein
MYSPITTVGFFSAEIAGFQQPSTRETGCSIERQGQFPCANGPLHAEVRAWDIDKEHINF